MYWTKVGGKDLSPAFKNFIIKFFTLKGSKRITLDQIKNDPWFNFETNISDNEIKRSIIEKFEKNGGAKGAFVIDEERVKVAMEDLNIMSQSTSVDDNETQSGYDKRCIEIKIDNVDASTNSMEVDECNYFDKKEAYLLTKAYKKKYS